MNRTLSELDGEYAGWIEFLGRHKTLVESGLADSPNATVRRKYSWLKNYHNAVIDENMANLEPGAMTENGAPWETLFRGLRIEA